MQQETVHLYLLDTLADWEYGYAVAGINSPMLPLEPGRYRVQTVGSSREPIRTAGGVTMVPDITLDELTPDASAMLILPGADTWQEPANMRAVERARAFMAAGVPVAAICGATTALAQGGLLDNHKHTGAAPEELMVDGYNGAALYQDEAATTDGDLITAGPTAPLEFAYHIFRRLNLYDDAVLEAWYGLFKTGEAQYYGRLMELAGERA